MRDGPILFQSIAVFDHQPKGMKHYGQQGLRRLCVPTAPFEFAYASSLRFDQLQRAQDVLVRPVETRNHRCVLSRPPLRVGRANSGGFMVRRIWLAGNCRGRLANQRGFALEVAFVLASGDSHHPPPNA